MGGGKNNAMRSVFQYAPPNPSSNLLVRHDEEDWLLKCSGMSLICKKIESFWQKAKGKEVDINSILISQLYYLFHKTASFHKRSWAAWQWHEMMMRWLNRNAVNNPVRVSRWCSFCFILFTDFIFLQNWFSISTVNRLRAFSTEPNLILLWTWLD